MGLERSLYDEKRQGRSKKIVKNGGYLENYDSIRKPRGFMKPPLSVSLEFLSKTRNLDVNRVKRYLPFLILKT